MKSLKNSAAGCADDYFDLVRTFPLRVLCSDQEHEEAVVLLSRLVGRKDRKLSEGERQYADALARFIQDFDQMEYPRMRSRRTPVEKLKYVMAESSVTPAELSQILGVSQPLTSHLLTGKRNLTVAHMRKLGSYFKIDPGYFL